MAILVDPSGTYHCRPIPPKYSKVEVELVERGFEDLELDIPGRDGEMKLGDTAHAIILWCKRYIMFPGRAAASSPPSPLPAPSPPPAPAPPPQSPPPATSPSPAPAPPPPPTLPAPSSSAPPSRPKKSCLLRLAPSKSTPQRKKPRLDEPKLPALKKRTYDCTPKENEEVVRAEVKAFFEARKPPKKIPIDPAAKKFFQKMSEPVKRALLLDYDRSVTKSFKKQRGKTKEVPQLGKQPKQSVKPLLPPGEEELRQWMKETGLNRAQLVGDAPITMATEADLKYKFKLGEPLVKPDQVNTLSTQMHRFHQWYMELSSKSRMMVGARIRNIDYYQGDDVLWINFENVFDVYQLDALDVSILSYWVL